MDATIIQQLANVSVKLGETAGPAFGVEIRMRLIGELSAEVRTKISEIIINNKYNDKPEYWSCRLVIIAEAIQDVFSDKLTDAEKAQLIAATTKRNKLLHVDFVDLMERMGYKLKGRQILSDGSKNNLQAHEIEEAIISINKNGMLDIFARDARETNDILDKLIIICKKQNTKSR
jgi:hypothetical protein